MKGCLTIVAVALLVVVLIFCTTANAEEMFTKDETYEIAINCTKLVILKGHELRERTTNYGDQEFNSYIRWTNGSDHDSKAYWSETKTGDIVWKVEISVYTDGHVEIYEEFDGFTRTEKCGISELYSYISEADATKLDW